MEAIYEILHNAAYVAIAVTAVYGIYSVILLWRQLQRRKFKNPAVAGEFVSKLCGFIQRGKYDQAKELCDAPEYWYTSVAWLCRDAIARRQMPPRKLENHLAGVFTREILTDMEGLLASINLVVKSEPMLGLLGTVIGMIGAFTTISQIDHPSPNELMGNLSVALYCTALGLISSIPLLMVGNFLQIRIRRLEESTMGHVVEVLEEMGKKSGGQ